MPSPYRFVAFDMDGTLIQQEVIDEIARVRGVEKEVSAITARAMNGELDFSASLRARAALLKGCPASVFNVLQTSGAITLTPGARELCAILKRQGFKMAVLSGGFVPLAEWVATELGLDHVRANTLAVNEAGDTLTGGIVGTIVNAERKAELLAELAAKEGVPLSQTVAVGDGANDLLMMKRAARGVAFNAKPRVQQEASCRINSKSLLDVVYVLGFERRELGQLMHYDEQAERTALEGLRRID